MLDPVSVAGLAVAVFDQLLKLGSKTWEIISEMRSLDQVRCRFATTKRKM